MGSRHVLAIREQAHLEQVMRELYGGLSADIAAALRHSEFWWSFMAAASRCLDAEKEQRKLRGVIFEKGFDEVGFRDAIANATSLYIQDKTLWSKVVTEKLIKWNLQSEVYPLIRELGFDIGIVCNSRFESDIVPINLTKWWSFNRFDAQFKIFGSIIILLLLYVVTWGRVAIADAASIEWLRWGGTAWFPWLWLIVLGLCVREQLSAFLRKAKRRRILAISCQRILNTVEELEASAREGRDFYDAEALIHRLRMCEADGFFVPSVVYRLLRMLADGGR